MAKRTGKFYRDNEKEVMRSLGLTPTPNSGSGWLVKEDGQSDEIICQLKSTDAKSIRVNKSDIDTLEYNALVAHKLPVFVIQFLSTNELYLLIKQENLTDITKYLKTGEVPSERFNDLCIEPDGGSDGSSEVHKSKANKQKLIKSSNKSRKAFVNAYDKQFEKQSKSAL